MHVYIASYVHIIMCILYVHTCVCIYLCMHIYIYIYILAIVQLTHIASYKLLNFKAMHAIPAVAS